MTYYDSNPILNARYFAFAMFVLVLVLFGLLGLHSSLSCAAKWERSGMASSWGPIQGCLVQLPDGRWIPDERVREIEIAPRKP